MEEKQEVSWYQAFRAWWYFTWRAMLAGMLGGRAAGFIMGFVMGIMGYLQKLYRRRQVLRGWL